MLTIGGVGIGAGNPCRFVAEISNNHNSDRDRCGRLIDAAKAAGADFVKFQCYTPDELIALRGDGPAPEPWGSQGWTMRTLYGKAQTPLEWFPKIAAHCERIGMPWFSSVFGLDSLACLEAVGCPAYKIARIDNRAAPLRIAVQGTGKPVFISRDRSGDINARGLNTRWLYCPPGYPPAPSAVALALFTEDGFLGLSSHCLDARLPVAAVARGCKLIEMHFQLDDEPSELEANVSLTAAEFADMIADVRATEALLA